MRASDAAIGELANAPCEADFGVSSSEDRFIRNLVRLVNHISPKKPAQTFAVLAGVGQRQSENIMAMRSGITLATFRRLLNNSNGWMFFVAFMTEMADGPLPEWFGDCKYHYESSLLEAELEAARRAIRDAKKLRKRT